MTTIIMQWISDNCNFESSSALEELEVDVNACENLNEVFQCVVRHKLLMYEGAKDFTFFLWALNKAEIIPKYIDSKFSVTSAFTVISKVYNLGFESVTSYFSDDDEDEDEEDTHSL